MSNDGCLQVETAKANLNTKPMVNRTQQERWKAAPLVALLRSRLGWMLCSSFDILKLLFTFPLFQNCLWFQKSLGKLLQKPEVDTWPKWALPGHAYIPKKCLVDLDDLLHLVKLHLWDTDDYMVNPHVGASSWIPWTPCFGPSGMARQHSEFRGWMC